MAENGKDKRVFARFVSMLPLKYRNLHTGFGGDVFTRDIGGGGLQFVTNAKLVDSNDLLEMRVDSPDSSASVDLKGNVIWVKETSRDVWGVGVRFNKTKLASLSKLCSSLIKTS